MRPFLIPKIKYIVIKLYVLMYYSLLEFKHGVLSYQVIPWIKAALCYCTTVGELIIQKNTYGGLKQPQYFPVKTILTLKGVWYGMCIHIRRTSYCSSVLIYFRYLSYLQPPTGLDSNISARKSRLCNRARALEYNPNRTRLELIGMLNPIA